MHPIDQLQHHQKDIARQIQIVFQVSYQVEAELLQVSNFPPLNRPLHKFMDTDTQFWAIVEEDQFLAIIEIFVQADQVDIYSLVVHPDHFRKGLAGYLLQFVFEQFPVKVYTVETGLKNIPAIRLYEKVGFQRERIWMTDIGIEKIAFKLIKKT